MIETKKESYWQDRIINKGKSTMDKVKLHKFGVRSGPGGEGGRNKGDIEVWLTGIKAKI